MTISNRTVLRLTLAVAMAAAFSNARLRAQAPAASPAPATPAAGELKVTLKWSTASEVDNYGFFIMRGDKEDGPWEQMNKRVVPGAGTVDTPSKYAWEDHAVEAGRTYYYYLESISLQGVREKFSPVLAKICCGPSTPEARTVEPPSPAPAPVATPAAAEPQRD